MNDHHDHEHEYTPEEIRRNRIQLLLILVPVFLTVAFLVARAVA